LEKKIDVKVATDFALCLGVMITLREDWGLIPNPRPAMFTYARAGEETRFEQDSRALGKDLVCLAFEPGREHEGPTNIAVYEERNGVLRARLNCSPYAFSKEGPCVLKVDGTDIGIACDGERLFVFKDMPTEDEDYHVEIGRALLRMMPQCLPAHIRRTQRLDPPITTRPANHPAGPGATGETRNQRRVQKRRGRRS
jgi:hypothetical protein